MPEISVIVPVYNMARYLPMCLQSVLEQTFSDFELICIDDCSIDDSWSVLERYAAQDDRVQLFCNEHNLGLSGTRNVGMSHAAGKYLFFLDADDFLEKEAFSILYERAEREKTDMILFDYRHLFEKGARVWKKPEYINYDGLEEKTYNGQNLFGKLMEGHRFEVQACFKFYSIAFLRRYQLGFYENIWHEDFLFSFQCMMNAKRVACCNKILYNYRKRADGISNVLKEKRAQSYFLVFLEVMRYWNEYAINDEIEPAVTSFLDQLIDAYYDIRFIETRRMELPFGKNTDRYLYDLFQKTRRVRFYITDKEWALLRNNKIYIYGAGEYGKDFFCELIRNDLSAEAFLVTKNNGEQTYCGKEVVEISEWQEQPNSIVVVAVSNKYKNDIVEQLEKLGHRRYLLLQK